MSISDDIYEAAKIDGCGFWNTLFRITIPNLSGTTNTLILLGIVGSLKTFDIVIQTTGGGPGRSTEFLNTYLYKAGVQQFNGGLSAAIGVMVLIIARDALPDSTCLQQACQQLTRGRHHEA